MSDIRRPLLDKLILDLSNLTHESSGNKLFAQVKKAFVEFPAETPVCELTFAETTEEIETNQENTRIYSYTSIVYDLLASNANQTDIDNRIDRLARIEDRVLDYLQKVNPSNLDGAIPGVNIYQIRVRPTLYSYQESEQGVRLYQQITFDIYVLIDVYSL